MSSPRQCEHKQNIGCGKPGGFVDLRHKLGLLVLEDEPLEQGELRIALDQARRTEVRLAAQRRMSKPKKVKVPKIPKPKKEKVKRETKPKRKKAKA